MNYNEAIKLLQSQGKFKINLGLERIYAILELLGNPQNKLKCIHVAGTNGKGSVCAMLAQILQDAGYKVGLYTSPHIFEYTERIKINGHEVDKEIFAKYIQKIVTLADKNNIDLTEFEILTAVMFDYFANSDVNYVVLETGLGGRFDATNVINSNMCSIITHIDFDHTERLGNTISKIAFEKAGIIKSNCPIITGESYKEIKDIAEKNHSSFILSESFNEVYELNLKGVYQQENLALVLTAIKYCFPNIDKLTIKNALKKVQHPFRFEYFPQYNLIVDGAHNPNGAKALKESLEFYYPNSPKRFIFGCLRNKNFQEMLETILNDGDEIYLYKFPHSNSADVDELKRVIPAYPNLKVKEFTSVECITVDKLNVICGSLYMISGLIEQLRSRISLPSCKV